MEVCIRLIFILSIAFISVCIGLSIKANNKSADTRPKCRLQEQYCDVMDPGKQCCPGTSCGIKRNGDHVSNLCLKCRDLGQPCNASNPSKQCCSGLKCQKITEYASACNPKAHRPFNPKNYSKIHSNQYITQYRDNKKH